MSAQAHLTPKLPGVCSVCDTPVRDVLAVDSSQQPCRWGARYPGTRIVTMAHLDGSTSDHSLCPTCEVLPDVLPKLWARAVLAYHEASPGHPDGPRFGRNVPVAVLSYTEATR